MKTSSLLCGYEAQTEQEVLAILDALIEKDDSFKDIYGIKKIYTKKTKECIGVGGLVRNKNFQSNYVVMSEIVLFLKSEYIGKGFGVFASMALFKEAQKLNNILIASVWEGNLSSKKLIEKNEMIFQGKTQKHYKDKSIEVCNYVKIPDKIIEELKNVNIFKFLVTNNLKINNISRF